MKFYISDLHFSHKNSLSFDNRPFFTISEMNEVIINNWNSVVSANDEVYILGDMFWNNNDINDILPMLKGRLYLIKGNHDRVNDEMTKRFVWIKDYEEIRDNDRHVVLCHYPIPCYKNHFYGWYHLYGHVHTSFEHNMMLHIREEMTSLYDKPCQMFNVGCMLPYMDYTPRTLDEIIQSNQNDYNKVGE